MKRMQAEGHVQRCKSGQGMVAASQPLSYQMVLLLKQILLSIKHGEQMIEAQRQKLASLKEFEPYAAF